MITFVYRSHYEGLLSKRIVKLQAKSIVAWFAERMVRAVNDPKLGNEDVGTAPSTTALWDELGGYVYGLSSIFERAKERGFEPPDDMAGLRRLLRAHLYVEGGPENIMVDEHSVRVLTDDDEVQLAYFFFDDKALERQDRLAYVLHDEPRLPPATGDGSLDLSEGLRSFTPRGQGKGATYVCLYTFMDGDSIPGKVGVFEGVRLPGLAAHMRAVKPDAKPQSWSAEYMDTWPLEMRLLRAALGPDEETTFTAALERLQQLPIQHIGASTNHSVAGIGPHEDAMQDFEDLGGERTRRDGDPSKSIIDEQPHSLFFAMHATAAFGHQQWILFDDVWAAAHPALARSMLRYGRRWDPLGEEPKPPRGEDRRDE